VNENMNEAINVMKAMNEKIRFKKIIRLLEKKYPSAGTTLFENKDPFRFLICVILSAQCTDAKVNSCAKQLFKEYPSDRALSHAPILRLKSILKPLGLANAKSEYVRTVAGIESEKGIEWTMQGLQRLPGVGRKTANVVLSEMFGISEGIAVDTHCARISKRLGLTFSENPIEIERDLTSLASKNKWGKITHLFIAHGRNICKARKPKCNICLLADICPSCAKI